MEKPRATETFEPPAWDGRRRTPRRRAWVTAPRPEQRPRTVSRDGETVEIDDSTLLARRG
jgi:hypothetical protein